ncbi:hypothetical protein E2C01_045237 [Portunus trituberculatus]|uniref:Uncharacterized protein n=1 Tax=Portunus trituberculatus TaxID=210409 RepID=A0A5B7G2A6_PORTR|nr:hypothetical protein [Portunus trituberculatus]
MRRTWEMPGPSGVGGAGPPNTPTRSGSQHSIKEFPESCVCSHHSSYATSPVITTPSTQHPISQWPQDYVSARNEDGCHAL